jgi:hypothetical protein
MFEQATVRTGIRYGVIGGISSFLIVIVLYFTGGDPYGQKSLINYLFIPLFMVMGLKYYKSFRLERMGYGNALAVAFSINLYLAVTAALLLYAFAVLAGPEVLQKHIAEMRLMMEMSREQAVQLVGEEAYKQAYDDFRSRSPVQIANEDFIRRLFLGSIVALVVALVKRG